MKKILISLFFYIVCLSAIESDYYPNQNGNLWIYEENIKYDNSDSIFIRYSVTVLGDTVMSNGKSYKIYKKEYLTIKEPTEYYYERVSLDSLNRFRYQPESSDEVCLERLSLALNEVADCCGCLNRILREIKDENVLGQLVNVKKFEHEKSSWLGLKPRHYAKNIGLIYEVNGSKYSLPIKTKKLIYAKVNSVEYVKNNSASIFTYPSNITAENIDNNLNGTPLTIINREDQDLKILKISSLQSTNTGCCNSWMACYLDSDCIPLQFPYTLSKGEILTIKLCSPQATKSNILVNDTIFIDTDKERIKIPAQYYGKALSIEKNFDKEITLYQNYPNPFNPETTIKYSIPKKELVKLSVYNSKGEMIKMVTNEKKEAGTYSVKFNASNLNSGVYYYKLETGSKIITNKMILVK